MIFLFYIFFSFIFNLLYKPKYTRFRPRGGFLFSAAMLFCISLKKRVRVSDCVAENCFGLSGHGRTGQQQEWPRAGTAPKLIEVAVT